MKFHKKHSAKIVEVWYKALVEATPERKLAFIYLANEIVQTTRKTTDVFEREFEQVIASACATIARQVPDSRTRKALTHTVAVWRDRSVFSKQVVQSILAMLEGPSQAAAPLPPQAPPIQAQAQAQAAAVAPQTAAQAAAAPMMMPAAAVTTIDGVVAALPDVEQSFARDVLRLLPAVDEKQRAVEARRAEAAKYDTKLFTGALLTSVRDKKVLENIACDFEEAARGQEALLAALVELRTEKSALVDTLQAYTMQLRSELTKLRESEEAACALLDAVPEQKERMAQLYHSFTEPAPASASAPQAPAPEPAPAETTTTEATTAEEEAVQPEAKRARTEEPSAQPAQQQQAPPAP